MSESGIFSRLVYLLEKEVVLEWRNLYSFGGVLLYLFSSVFIVYKVVNNADPVVWNALYWILFLFTGVSAMVKSFTKETGRSSIFYYTLFNPYEVLLAKLIYNTILMAFLAFLILVLLQVFLPATIANPSLMATAIILASLGLSINFSFISAISSQGTQNSTMLSIMAFPIVIPVLLLALKISAQALNIISDSDIDSDILMMAAINLIMLGLSLTLFPYLWKS